MELAARLIERRPEIEAAALTRIGGIVDPTKGDDVDYVDGLQRAVSAALDYTLDTVEGREYVSRSTPGVFLAQARIAARNGMKLQTLLRRYFAGHALFCDFLVEEAMEVNLMGSELRRLLRGQATLCDRLLAAASAEYEGETQKLGEPADRRRAEKVTRLLAGELIDSSGLAYDFDIHHLGAIALGPGASVAIRRLATALDRRLLSIRRGDNTVWAWLGGLRVVESEGVDRAISATWPDHLSLALGESAHGLAGWRLTHWQAKAALPIAMRSDEPVRYGDVPLLASLLQDELLTTSLRELYLNPLTQERDGGEVARETLRAYFDSGRNVSSAAAALGVNRHTVSNRLRAVEHRLGRTLSSCGAEVEAALRLEDVGGHPQHTFLRDGDI